MAKSLGCSKVMGVLALLFCLSAHGDDGSDRYEIRFRKVVDGVWMAYRPEPLRPYVEGNVTIIVNASDVIVVDASGSPRTARKVIAKIRELTPNPVRYVVLTHIHRDHRLGLQAYLEAYPGVEVIAHPRMKELVESPRGKTFMADTIARLEKNLAEGDTAIREIEGGTFEGKEQVAAHLSRYYERDLPAMLEEYRTIPNNGPTAGVDSRLVLHRGARTIEILFLGRGDTDHDLVVHLPRERVVAAGDLVVHPFPYGFSDQPDEWVATLRRLAALDFDHLVPGHGELQKGNAYVLEIVALVESVHEQVAAGIAEGLDEKGVRDRVDLTAFEARMTGGDPILRHYFHEYFVTPAVERAYKAKSGRD